MDGGTLVAGESDVAVSLRAVPPLSLPARRLSEHALRIGHPDHFVELHEVECGRFGAGAATRRFCCAALSLLRPSILVMRNAFSR